MMSPSETKKTDAIRESLMELVDPSAPGNRVERSIRETLYKALSTEERSTMLDDMVKQGYDRTETAESLNNLHEYCYGTDGPFA